MKRKILSILAMAAAVTCLNWDNSDRNTDTRNSLQVKLTVAYHSGKTLGDKISAISKLFVGRKYKRDPLGEGGAGKVDTDPRLNLKHFDCLTFVEQMMALAIEPHLNKVRPVLDKIRYINGKVGYTTRKHSMEYHWVPSTIKDGFIKDITLSIGGLHTKYYIKKYHKRMWRRWGYRKWPRLLGKTLPKGALVASYLPLKRAIRLVDKIPNGTIMTEVRKPKRYHPEGITHVGLVVVKNNKRYFRHATCIRANHVVDMALKPYLKRLRYMYRRWPVVGISLFQPLEWKNESPWVILLNKPGGKPILKIANAKKAAVLTRKREWTKVRIVREGWIKTIKRPRKARKTESSAKERQKKKPLITSEQKND